MDAETHPHGLPEEVEEVQDEVPKSQALGTVRGRRKEDSLQQEGVLAHGLVRTNAQGTVSRTIATGRLRILQYLLPVCTHGVNLETAVYRTVRTVV